MGTWAASMIHEILSCWVTRILSCSKKIFRGPFIDRLCVIDLRTFRPYSIPIKRNAVLATDFRKIVPSGVGNPTEGNLPNGLTLLDPGFRNTAVGESGITYIDGNLGVLQYRQYPINYLFTNHDYEDVVHLLVWGYLPTQSETLQLRSEIARQMVPDQSTLNVIKAFSSDAPPYLVVAAGLSAWAASNPIHATPKGYESAIEHGRYTNSGVYKCLAAFTIVVAATYCHQQDKPFVLKVDESLSSIENMLVMMGRSHDKQACKVLNQLWVLFADHEMTNSTAAFLNAASCLSDPISACIASVASGNGPLHAGAIDLAYNSFTKMKNKAGVQKHMIDVRAKKCRLMGVGHRVYRTVDPRIPLLRSLMSELQITTSHSPLLEVAMEIDRTVATDTYFTSRNLCVNADLYSSFIYSALGFDSKIFTPLAMTARCAGVLAHWRESLCKSEFPGFEEIFSDWKQLSLHAYGVHGRYLQAQ